MKEKEKQSIQQVWYYMAYNLTKLLPHMCSKSWFVVMTNVNVLYLVINECSYGKLYTWSVMKQG